MFKGDTASVIKIILNLKKVRAGRIDGVQESLATKLKL